MMLAIQDTMSFTDELDASRELTDQELDQVSGGLVVIAIIAVLIGMLLPAVQKVR